MGNILKILASVWLFYSIQNIDAQVLKHKYLAVSAEFIQSGMLGEYEVLHLHIQNETRKNIVMWLPMWSMIALNVKNPSTKIHPGNSQSLNYLYIGFGIDTKDSDYGNILPNYIHLKYTDLEGNKGVVKVLKAKESFDIHLLISDSLTLKSLNNKIYRSVVLLMKVSTDKKFFDEYITDTKVFYPFQSYYLKDAFFYHYDTYAPASFIYQRGEDNTEIFPLDLYDWFYYDSNNVVIKRK